LDIDIDLLATKIAQKIATPSQRWLSLTQATQYSHIGKQKLIDLATKRQIYGFQDRTNGKRSWIFDRKSIDAYRLAQGKADFSDNEQIAMDIVNGLRL